MKYDGNPEALGEFFDSPNRGACLEALHALYAGSGRKKKGAAIKIYLENFKSFNDTFGYHQGGQLLNEIILFFCGLPGADVYRYGGVEFVVLLEKSSYSDTVSLAQEIVDRFESTWQIAEVDCMCAVDVGVGFFEYAESVDELLEHLDIAVTQSAQAGQNQVTLFNSELQTKLYRKTMIAKLLRSAIMSDDIEIRYRPTFCVPENRYTRAECYLRLLTVEFGPVAAAEFLPIAEETGIICSVGRYVIQKTCELIHELMEQKVHFESIAVPISPVQFLQESFVRDVASMLKEYNIPSKKLAFEITESVLVTSFSRVNIAMEELSELGVEIVLNEFGTGYSGVNNILTLPVDVLKLERMFVWQLETNLRSGHVIEGLVRIANGLELKIIAEGVETENQNSLLGRYDCNYRQGFFYSATVDRDEVIDLFRS